MDTERHIAEAEYHREAARQARIAGAIGLTSSAGNALPCIAGLVAALFVLGSIFR